MRDWDKVLDRLLSEGRESEVVEFKESNADPVMIGERLSSLANSAALVGQPAGYLVWGVQDKDLVVVGTTVDLRSLKGKGNEDLLPWLSRSLTLDGELLVGEIERAGHRLVVLEVPAAVGRPVRFRGEAYVRRQSYCKVLGSEPVLERHLWERLTTQTFEDCVVAQDLEPGDLFEILDVDSFFQLMHVPRPASQDAVLQVLVGAGVIRYSLSTGWSVAAGGALLFARDLRRFVDGTPQSRNEWMARVMRMIGVCEERGSGWDKIVEAVEEAVLPAPRVVLDGRSTRVVLLGPRQLSLMDTDDRINAIYFHACLRYVNQRPMTNTSVRERFGITAGNRAQVSRFIKEALDSGAIAIENPGAGTKARRYLPSWAAAG